MTTEITPTVKTQVEEPLVLHAYATKCWQDVRLSDIFRLRLNTERSNWHQYIGHFNDSCEESAK